MTREWPFEEAPNTAVISLRQIVQEGAPILHVVLDDEGEWQFLGWDTPDMQDAVVVSLRSMVERDLSIVQLYDLPLGWHAWRRHTGEAWTRQPLPDSAE